MVRGYNETPWFDVSSTPGEKKNFDLELEKKTADDLIAFIQHLMAGETVEDQFGTQLTLADYGDRVKFLDKIRDSQIFRGIVSAKFSENERRLLGVIFGMIDK